MEMEMEMGGGRGERGESDGGVGVGGGEFPSVPLGFPQDTEDTSFNGEPWHLPCPRNAARKGTDGTSRPPSVLAPGSLRVDRRHWAVGGWWLALCRRALGATWSCGGGRGRSSSRVRWCSSRGMDIFSMAHGGTTAALFVVCCCQLRFFWLCLAQCACTTFVL